MGVVTGNAIIKRAQRTLLDDGCQPGGGQKRWSVCELQQWLVAGIREIVKVKPDTAVKNIEVTPVAGVKQRLPDDGQLLIDVRGTTCAITPVKLPDMDASVPSWRTEAAAKPVHFMHDERDPHVYYLYPQSDGSTVELVYSFIPAYDNAGAPIPVDDTYGEALYHFILARAYEKNAKRGDLVKSGAHDAIFYQRIGIREQKQFAYAGGVTNDAVAQ